MSPFKPAKGFNRQRHGDHGGAQCNEEIDALMREVKRLSGLVGQGATGTSGPGKTFVIEQKLPGATTTTASGGQTVLNDSLSAVVAGRVYGRDSTGRVALADAATGADQIEPRWVALEGATPGSRFPFTALGQATVLAEPIGTWAKNDPAYLSTTTPGAVTPTAPTTADETFHIGFFASTDRDGNGATVLDVFIPGAGNTGTNTGDVSLTGDLSAVLSLAGQILGLEDQPANVVFAGPASGADAAPGMRALVTADLSSGMVTLAKMANQADQTILGNNTGGAAAPLALTAAQARTVMGVSATGADASYLLLAGRASGQTAYGGTASGEDLTLSSTAHATKGSITIGTMTHDEVNGYLGINTTTPEGQLDVDVSSGSQASYFRAHGTGLSGTNYIIGVRTAGTKASPLPIDTFSGTLGASLLIVEGRGMDSDGNIQKGGHFGVVPEAIGSGYVDACLRFATWKTGVGTNKLWITAAGTVAVIAGGTLPSFAHATADGDFVVEGIGEFQGAVWVAGNLDVTGTSNLTGAVTAPGGVTVTGGVLGTCYVAETISDTVNPLIQLKRSRAASAAIQSGDTIGQIGFAGKGATVFKTGALIKAIAGENFTDSASGSYIVFSAVANGATTTPEVARIDSNGLTIAQGGIVVSGTGGFKNTAGGMLLGRTATADADHTIANTEFGSVYSSLTAARTLTLPSSPVAGQLHYLHDESGAARQFPVTISGAIDDVTNPVLNENYFGKFIHYTGSAWKSIGEPIACNFHLTCIQKTGIDFKTTGNTQVGTTPNGSQRFIPLFVIWHVRAATSITVAATVTLGTSSGATDILSGTTLTSVLSTNQFRNTNLAATVNSSIAPNTAIWVGVTTGATGTSQSMDVEVWGILIG